MWLISKTEQNCLIFFLWNSSFPLSLCKTHLCCSTGRFLITLCNALFDCTNLIDLNGRQFPFSLNGHMRGGLISREKTSSIEKEERIVVNVCGKASRFGRRGAKRKGVHLSTERLRDCVCVKSCSPSSLPLILPFILLFSSSFSFSSLKTCRAMRRCNLTVSLFNPFNLSIHSLFSSQIPSQKMIS